MKLSLQPFKLLLASVVIGPFLGLCYSYFSQRTLIGLQADEELLLHFGAYVAILLLFLVKLQSSIRINTTILDNSDLAKIINRLLIAICCITIIIFFFAGSKILSGESNRGSIRVELGLLAPIYAFSLKYALPTIAFVIAICMYLTARIRPSRASGYKSKLNIALGLIVFCAFMSGAKFTLVMVCLPLVCFYWAAFNWSAKTLLVVSALAFMVGSHIIFQSSDFSLMSSINYIYARATRIAAYGVLGCWEYVSTRDFDTLPAIMNGILGRRLGELALSFLDPVASSIFADPHRLITVMYYPSYDRAVEGTTGLTLTLFGELVLHLRLFWFVGFVFFLGWFSVVLRFTSDCLETGKLLLGITGFIYMIMVLLPVLNSGLVFKMISLPFFIHMLGVTILIKFLLGKNKSNRKMQISDDR